MIPDSSSTLHHERFIRPVMTRDDIIRLIRNVAAAEYARGFAASDRGHEVLDEPEFILTELLRVPVSERDQLERLYKFHFLQTQACIAAINRIKQDSIIPAVVVQLHEPHIHRRKRAANRL